MANELEVRSNEKNLPVDIEKMLQKVLFSDEEAKIARDKYKMASKFGASSEIVARSLREAQIATEIAIDAQTQLGELMLQVPKSSGGDHGNQFTGGKSLNNETFGNRNKQDYIKSKTGFDKSRQSELQRMASHPEIVERVKEEAKAKGEFVTKQAILKEIKAEKKAKEIEKAKESIASQRKEQEQAVLYVGNGIGFIPNEPYDLLLTDPPYMTDVDDIESFANSWLPNALSHVKDTGFAFVFIGAYPKELRAYLNIEPPSHLVLEQQLIWTYRNTLGQNPKGRYKLNYQSCLFYKGINAPDLDCPLTNEQWAVQDINAPDGRIGDRYHEWQKPLEIAERFIRHTTKKGDTVFDPFACTGTFLLAAASLGRKGYGFEIMQKNAEIAESRGVVIG